MTWNTEEWDTFCGLLEEAWPGDFDEHTAQAWRVLLDPVAPPAAIEGLRRLLLEGHRFRPSVSQVLEAARRDPSRPGFDEMLELVYGRTGVIRTGSLAERGRFKDDGEKRAAFRDAAIARARELHPLVGRFVAVQGLDRLRTLPLEDPQWGTKHRADLERAWKDHVETWDGREVAILAAGPDRQHLGVRRFDPLAALGFDRDRPQLEQGTP